MAIRIARMSGLPVLMGFLSAVVACGCTPKRPLTAKAPPPQVTQVVYPTIEEAAVGAWDFHDPDLPSEDNHAPQKGFADRAATIRLWKSRPQLLHEITADLNGDGIGDVLLCNADFVDMDGKEQTAQAGVGQWCLWAAIQKVADGWRVVGCGWGRCPPDVQEQTTNGWKNLIGGYHLSAGQGIDISISSMARGTSSRRRPNTVAPPARRTTGWSSEA